MDKRWTEMYTRLEALEKALRVLTREMRANKTVPAETAVAPTVTKEQLMKIKGVGESTAKAILKLLND
jgi:DNA uptake protein ComE-like DNA-binding protein